MNEVEFTEKYLWKAVILRKTNIANISLKKCNLFFLYFFHRGIHNCRLKDLENLDLTFLVFPPDCENLT